MGDRAREIAGSMTALSDVSGRAKSGMDEITTSIESILKAAREVSETGEENLEEVKELEALIRRFKVS
jgi:methyl-accepting chemotaxis protein